VQYSVHVHLGAENPICIDSELIQSHVKTYHVFLKTILLHALWKKLSVYNVCGFYTEEFYAMIPTFFFGFLLSTMYVTFLMLYISFCFLCILKSDY